jgi:hypothetical protein
VAAFEGLKSGDPEDNGFKEPRVLEKKNDAPQVLKSDWMPAPETFGKENNIVDAKSPELEKRI